MTSRQFACLDCKQYINAGYRWCYTHLERPGVVTAGEFLDVEKALVRAEYWAIPAAGPDTELLAKLLPEIHAFLLFHRKHELRFGEAANEHFYSGTDFLEWDDAEPGEPFDISVQSLYANGCREWVDVELYMKSRRLPVWWWGQPEIMEEAQRRFAVCVTGPKPPQPKPTP